MCAKKNMNCMAPDLLWPLICGIIFMIPKSSQETLSKFLWSKLSLANSENERRMKPYEEAWPCILTNTNTWNEKTSDDPLDLLPGILLDKGEEPGEILKKLQSDTRD